MKTIFKISLVYVLLFFAAPAKGQWVNIPDTNFRNWLFTSGYMTCMNGNFIDTTCTAVVNATNITCVNRGITDLTGIEYFRNLRNLNCFGNALTSLPVLPDSLIWLNCTMNQLTSLNNLPSTLETIYCAINPISTLPVLPTSLKHLACGSNQLSNLPSLPNSLEYLDCNTNQLTVLPPLPASLKELICESNQLTSFPPLPNELQYLGCGNNLLGFLPVLPDSLAFLYCWQNQLSFLPALPISLMELSCETNQLTTLPSLPDSLFRLDISNNPLACLPEIKKIDNFYWTNTNIQCLPNYIQIDYAVPASTNLPLCQPSENCPVFWNIQGNVYNDTNTNCINDAENNLQYIPVKLDSAGIFKEMFLSNDGGNFSFRAGYGNYTVSIDTTDLPFDVICPVTFAHASVLSAGNAYDSLANFGLQCKPGFDLQAKSISPDEMFRPAAQRTLYLNAGDAARFYGTTCATGIIGTVQAILSGPVSYVAPAAGAVAPTTVIGNIITWNVADFALSNPTTDFNIIVGVDTTANIGDTICVQLSVTPVSGDNNPLNNSITACYPVVNSMDPNEKYMSPSGAVDSSQQWFTFTVFFQNTGNAPAEDIYLLDTLDGNLDAATFSFLSSSHDVITQLLPGNVLRFNYPDINLPDSVNNEPGSHGYVQFKVKRKQGLPIGTTITNTAYIYFDFNAAIVTNTVSATLTVPTSVNEIFENNFSISPNPTNGNFRIVYAKQNEAGTLQIFDLAGKKVFESRLPKGSTLENFNMSFLENGIYNAVIKIGDYRVGKKLVVIK